VRLEFNVAEKLPILVRAIEIEEILQISWLWLAVLFGLDHEFVNVIAE